MANFWNTVDTNYFREVSNEEVLAKLETMQARRTAQAQPKFENCLPKPLVNKVERIFSKEKLTAQHTGTLAQKDHQNFLKHYVVSLLSYVPVLEFLKKKITPCDSCLQKVLQVFAEKHNYSPNFNGDEQHDSKLLDAESRALDMVITKKLPLWCKSCLAAIHFKRPQQKSTDSNAFLQAKNSLKANSKRLTGIILALNKRVLNANKLLSKTSIAFEIEVQKDYLFASLIRIEQRLLAENVYKINSVFKSQLAEIEFINYPSSYAISLNELKFLNNFRENSLFKIHKVAFKCHSSFYSFNNNDHTILRKRTAPSDDLINNDRFEFASPKKFTKQAETAPPDQKNICHHCKFIGPSEFFYKCSQKFISSKNKHSEDIYKAFFNIKNGLFLNCDKKYCLYCVQNCYHSPLKKSEPKTWVCPFCTNSCYCNSCEYRDLYIRVFELFIQLGGDVDKLKTFSPIERVVNRFLMADFGRDSEDIPVNTSSQSRIANKTMKRLKDVERVGNSLLKIKQCFKIGSEECEQPALKFASKALLRRHLVDKLNLVSEVIRREKLRYDLIKII
jgi:hypothetical protein